jgi:predicted phosphodiesterase
MRIGLIGDTHGYVPALEAVLAGCRRAAPDLVVHCGDFLSSPFTADPPEESIALLRSENVQAIIGNGEAYLRDWGTPRFEVDLELRRARSDPLGDWIDDVPAGQAELTPEDLTWLRALPDELILDAARPGDVYVCHGMPGNPFSGIWPARLGDTLDRHITPEQRDRALAQPGPAGADLILCGHTHTPFVQPTPLPNGRVALAVRGQGTDPTPDPGLWSIGYVILTHHGPALYRGYAEWDIQLVTIPFAPRDPTWTSNQPPRRTRR